jgi:hypothetical protein
VIIEQGRLMAEEVEEEFKDLVDENWDWQVRQISASYFVVVFPSKESLSITIRGGGLTLPTSKLKALITVQVGDPLAPETLVETWVRLIGVPPPLRHADRLLLSTRELGRPIGVDMDSLAHPSAPIRMSVGCQAPVQIQEYITLFVNMQGYRIRIEREDPAEETRRRMPRPRPRLKEEMMTKTTRMKKRMRTVGTAAEDGTARATKKRPRPRQEGLGAQAVSL